MGLSIVDLMTGLDAAFALVSGVLSARATGTGRDIDVSLFDAALQNLSYLAVWYLNAGVNQGREPRSGHPSLTPSQLYRTRDGFIFIMCNKEKFWPVLCDAIGQPEWSDAARLQGLQGAARQPRQADRGARRGAVGAHDGGMDRALRRTRAGGAGPRRDGGARKSVRRGRAAACAPPSTPTGPIRLLAPLGRLPGRGAAVHGGAGDGRGYGRGPRRVRPYYRRDRPAAGYWRDLSAKPARASALAQLEALDLARRGLGQAVHELDPARDTSTCRPWP